jgi:hypothetical protein
MANVSTNELGIKCRVRKCVPAMIFLSLSAQRIGVQSWAPNLARGSGQDSVTIGCNALFGTEGAPVLMSTMLASQERQRFV